ncbi:MAG: 50S ribosomal protein L35ae [Candidatus Woesearchaeota archaeon]|nr:50S ribosomal protein L35ae [Candidatus Woesearchaeota archaeon]
MTGKIASAHGNSGAVKAIFDTGMPGQSLGQKVSIE